MQRVDIDALIQLIRANVPGGGEGYIRIMRLALQFNTWAQMLAIGILIGCGLLATLFAVYVGYRMATAEDEAKRKQAKDQLVYSVIGMLVAVVMAVLLFAVVPNVVEGWEEMGPEARAKNPNFPLAEFYCLVAITQIILNIIQSCACVFAVYLGWQLMKAEDEGKRKDAKLQLIWAIAGIFIVIFLNTIATSLFSGMINR